MAKEQLFVRFEGYGGQDIPLISSEINWTFDSISTFSFSIQAKDIDWKNSVDTPVSIHDLGRVLKFGKIIKRPNLQLTDDESIVAQFECEDYLTELSCYRRKPDAIYNFADFEDVMNDLISYTNGDWVWVDINAVITKVNVDLRHKATLFSQISEVVRSIPYQHLRYGGLNSSGQHILEIGYFYEQTLHIEKGANLIQLEYVPEFSRCYSLIEPVGQLSGSSNITLEGVQFLQEYQDNDNKDDYPIDKLSDGTWVTLNIPGSSAYIGGQRCTCEITKQYPLVKTNNGQVASVLERLYGGYQLWLLSVKDLINSADHDTYDATIITRTIPKPGDSCYVRGTAQEPVFDRFGDCIGYVDTFEVDSIMRILSVSTNVSEQAINQDLFNDCDVEEWDNQYIVNVRVSERDDLADFDPDLNLFYYAERTNFYENFEVNCENTTQYASFTFNEESTTDCSDVGPEPGFLVEAEVPTCRPAAATNVSANLIFFCFGCGGANVTASNVTTPANLSGTASACLTLDNGSNNFDDLPSGWELAVDWQFIFS